MIKNYLAVCLLFLLTACGQQKKEVSVKTYFDVEGYFSKEEIRLNALNKAIAKTVTINGESESKSLVIKDWKKEFGTFTGADINKISWKGLFRISTGPDVVLYTSDKNDEKVQVKLLRVEKRSGDVQRIFAVIQRKNMIYTSSDTLDYVREKYYSIIKTQKIRLMKEKKYRITGKF